MKKAALWLSQNNIAFKLHDYRKDGLDPTLLQHLEKNIGWETLLNKRGTTWRKLNDNVKNSIDQSSALAVMLEQPAMIKRPVLVKDKKILVGFKADQYQAFFND
jgi:Spx/MgsR family transcriptional regulator